jgi:serine/threonine-protein phosphatase 2A catalytic subunit
VWQIYTQKFSDLLFAALVVSSNVDTKILCVHGGLSPELKKIADIEQIERHRELPHKGPMCDLVWSDPVASVGYRPSLRDAEYQFGAAVTCAWN